jgi:hypothetical protein
MLSQIYISTIDITLDNVALKEKKHKNWTVS